jgi:hypothetical protein
MQAIAAAEDPALVATQAAPVEMQGTRKYGGLALGVVLPCVQSEALRPSSAMMVRFGALDGAGKLAMLAGARNCAEASAENIIRLIKNRKMNPPFNGPPSLGLVQSMLRSRQRLF